METTSQEMTGACLQRERETRSVSVAAAARVLHVSAAVIRAVERDDWSVFPQKDDIPDFVKRYAKFLLVDADALLRRLEVQIRAISHRRPGGDSPPGGLEPGPTPAAGDSRSKRGRRLVAWGLGLFLLFILLAALLYRYPVKVLQDRLRQMEVTVESKVAAPPQLK